MENFNECVDVLRKYSVKGDFSDYPESIIDFDGIVYKGKLVGNDECFDVNRFYHYLIDFENKKIYKMYFELTDEEGNDIELDTINYDKPYEVEECDEYEFGWF